VDEVLGRIEAVTLEEANVMAAQIFGQAQALAVVGPDE